MDLLSIDQDKCRQCNRCVRDCPTNALKIDHGRVTRIERRCILCGSCFKFCQHGAVVAQTPVAKVLELLNRGDRVVACLDPTFPAVLDRGSPGQLVSALKKLGFSEVWESAFGGDLVARAYNEWLSAHPEGSFISSFCPSVVLYIEKFAPDLRENLMPLASPMVATGMAVKKLRGKDTKVVFFGSCISRIWERKCDYARPYVDFVLTYHDISRILEDAGIDREAQEPSHFDGPRAGLGRALSIAGGLSKCIGFDQDLLNLDLVIEAGPKHAIRALKQLEERSIQPRFLDILFCNGCIDGPIVDQSISGPSRKRIVVDFVKSQYKSVWSEEQPEALRPESLDLSRSFPDDDVSLPEPSERQVRSVLAKLGKSYPNRNLDCGGCGYGSCREKAVAVIQGLAEFEMCPHYLLTRTRGLYSRLERSHKQLQKSHLDLEQTQRQLIHSAKMASLGQLAAGVAHEINNPLGTIMLFGRMLQKELADNPQWTDDAGLIVKEAERAAKIVKDLLSFSRETKIRPGVVQVNDVIREALALMVKRTLFRNIQVKEDLDPKLPTTFADPDLLKQVFFNITLNGAQAMEGKGVLTLKSRYSAPGRTITISIKDTGKGIPKENLPRLFEPFFTTKERGTGLGLALVYGIISKHKGAVRVESEVEIGTTFFIDLPVLDEKSWLKQTKSGIVDIQHAKGEHDDDSESQSLIG